MCMSAPDTPKKQTVAPAQTPNPMANPDNTPNSATVGGQRAASAGRNALRIDLTQPTTAATAANGLTIPQG
ncbi:hypothetical protein SAMN06265784_104150 [Paraburkholderia susongensis]|uniref:Uncharacterized protein n=1 Tax=Paraburkholderia susongensis TaxID=1515439 RepID=A0A1X7KP72_9BURK|nr:hypothetical protein SAMN06265784_104150 [Paraburkholderia susongensis]